MTYTKPVATKAEVAAIEPRACTSNFTCKSGFSCNGYTCKKKFKCTSW